MAAKRPAIDRFLAKVIALDPEQGECWVWQGSKSTSGYGQFGIARSTHVYAHRWSYEHFKGPIRGDYVIDHLCERKDCVNPDHLEMVTQSQNALRARRLRIGWDA